MYFMEPGFGFVMASSKCFSYSKQIMTKGECESGFNNLYNKHFVLPQKNFEIRMLIRISKFGFVKTKLLKITAA